MAAHHALLLTDIVDSTRLTEELDEEAATALWSAHDRLAPVARQGNVTVWTAGRGLAAELAKVAEGVATAPRIRALPGSVAEVRDEVRQGIVVDLARVADGPVGQATIAIFTGAQTPADALAAAEKAANDAIAAMNLPTPSPTVEATAAS
jgi:class 3 adenylate cyclase